MLDGVADSHAPPTLGEIIRRQRELSAMSMRQFAEMVGISNPYLSQIERGLREPSEKVVEAIARNLDVSADVLYRQAGLDPDAEEGEEPAARIAIRDDPRLNARQRQALLEVYDAFVGEGRPARRRRRRPEEGNGTGEGES
jgi:transcriptional regulator with XRE-family HTH domain